jgi:hypothetical protein
VDRGARSDFDLVLDVMQAQVKILSARATVTEGILLANTFADECANPEDYIAMVERRWQVDKKKPDMLKHAITETQSSPALKALLWVRREPPTKKKAPAAAAAAAARRAARAAAGAARAAKAGAAGLPRSDLQAVARQALASLTPTRHTLARRLAHT